MLNKPRIYWLCQISGWSFFVLVNLLFNTPSLKILFNYLFLLVVGIALTHAYRYFILQFKILKLKIVYQLFFIAVSSLMLSVIFCVAGSVFFVLSLEEVINGIVPFLFWSIIYFGFHYLENYKKTEIQNLRWEAASKDIELNKLKSQLNPHFMFNSMNSIRALIDENPAKAKEAVTQLSNILRNTLLMNKNKEIVLEEELRIVKDYLDLEQIRYEERLRYDMEIDPSSVTKLVPPLIIQAQVENAIKHGISKIPGGGLVKVKTKIQDNILFIEVKNTGTLSYDKSDSGFGFANSQQRLELLYGKKASIEISEENSNEVTVRIKISYN